MSCYSAHREITPVWADFLVERRGFEPLTSAVQAPARLTGSSFPFLGGSSATSATAGAGLSPTPVPAPCVASASNVSPVSTRTAWLRSRPQSAARSHRRRADRTRRRGKHDRPCRRDEGRARAKERVDDVAAVGEIEKGADAYVVHHNTKQLKFTPGSNGVLGLTSLELRFVSRSSTPVRLPVSRLPG